MKNLIKCCGLLLFLAFSSCRSENYDPVKGIKIQYDLQVELISTNAMTKGQVFERTKSINLRDTFKNRYNIDPDQLDSFFVSYLLVWFNQDNCKLLDSYSFTTEYPVVGRLTLPLAIPGQDKCDLPIVSGNPAIVELSTSKSDFFSQTLVKTNLASYIKAGYAIPVSLRMVARDPIPEGFGAVVQIRSRAYYKPK
jgi:dipeptidyl aminopeptidase/acylaminoacyl peptidase